MTTPSPDGAPRQGRVAEHRLPAIVAVLAGAVLYAALPSEVAPAPRFAVPVLELLLLVPLVAVNPRRFTRETAWSRALSLLLVGVIAVANLVSLALLVRALLYGETQEGRQLLLAALQVWLTNIIVFGLAYWELDRGGPVKRTQLPREELPAADFRFSQDENDDAVLEVAVSSSGNAGWTPTLVDYLYVSVTNSTAFSPTDTMPLSTRAKILMSVQCMAAVVT
ncbi:MAG: hypothetical protein M3326_07055, partial [Actinomycetota bacterium]|nr:hypothetical protein [Actinomycetota bacterium]